MKKLIYLCPALICFAFGGLLYITTEKFTDAGMSKAMIALPATVEAAVTFLLNFLIVKILNERNAGRLVVAGGIIMALTSILFRLFGNLYAQLVWMGLFGIAFCLYCAPFQLFMKCVERNASSGVARAAGRYTAAWSLGFATGPVVFAMLEPETGYIVCAIAGLLIAAIVIPADAARRKAELLPETGSCNGGDGEKQDVPDFAAVGWIVGGVGLLTVCMLRSMWQPYGKELGIPDKSIAYVLSLISYVQGFVALALTRSKNWMFRTIPVALMGLAGVVSMACFRFGSSVNIFYIAAAVYGIYSGCYYFVFVYYSLIHPVKAARNAVINEIIVGGLGIPAPVVIGIIAQRTGIPPVFTFFTFMALLAVIIHITAVMRLHRTETGKGI